MIDYAEFIMAQLKTKAGEREAIEVSVWKKFREIMNHRASLRRRKELYVLTWKSFVTIIYSVLKHGTKNAKKMGVQNKNKNRNYLSLWLKSVWNDFCFRQCRTSFWRVHHAIPIGLTNYETNFSHFHLCVSFLDVGPTNLEGKKIREIRSFMIYAFTVWNLHTKYVKLTRFLPYLSRAALEKLSDNSNQSLMLWCSAILFLAFSETPSNWAEKSIKSMKAILITPRKKRDLNYHFTLWKLQDFYINQILREINFAEYRCSKSAVLAILGALNFVNLGNFSLQQVPIFTQI